MHMCALSMYMVTMPMYPCHCVYVHGLYVWGVKILLCIFFVPHPKGIYIEADLLLPCVQCTMYPSCRSGGTTYKYTHKL